MTIPRDRAARGAGRRRRCAARAAILLDADGELRDRDGGAGGRDRCAAGAAAAGACAGHAAPAGAARRCRPSICWSCSPSCCRHAVRRRRRAGWRWRWTSIRRRAGWRTRPRRCPTSRRRCCGGWRRGGTPRRTATRRRWRRGMGQAGWGWAPSVLAALGSAGRGRLDRAAAGVADGCRNGRRPRRLPAAGIASGAPRRRRAARLAAMLGPAAEQRPGQADYAGAAAAAFAPREPARRSASGAGRGRHRHRQDAGLHRAGQPLGGDATTARSGSAPSPGTCSARSTPNWRGCSPTRPSGAAAWWCARGARTTCAC